MTELLWLLPLILALVAWEGWMLYEGRPRNPKDSGADHVHQGGKRSQHEASGQQIVVVECRQCGCHFNYEVAGA